MRAWLRQRRRIATKERLFEPLTSTTLPKAFGEILMVGVGATGKSLFGRYLNEMLCGSESRSEEDPRRRVVEDLTFSRLKSQFELARIKFCRLITFPDAGNETLSTSVSNILKNLISMESAIAEEKFRGAVSYRPQGKLLFHTNSRWATRDWSSGY